jgi:hypothetical protein
MSNGVRYLDETDAANRLGVGEVFESAIYRFFSLRRRWQEMILYWNMFSWNAASSHAYFVKSFLCSPPVSVSYPGVRRLST